MSGKVLTISATGSRVERPTSFLTVAAAELAAFLPGETCSVLETRRFYLFDAASSEARDGIRVLTPAGGGRLLHAPWVMNATEIEFGTPTIHLPDLQAVVSHNWSAALMDGGGFTDNGDGTYSLAAAESALRQPVGGQGATIGLYNVAAVNNQSIADGTQTYITVKLTGSTAAYATQQDLSLITGRDEIEAYSITRVGSNYHVVDLRRQNVDHAQLACRMEWDTKGISKVQGTAYSSSASNRYLQVSAGKFHVPIRLSATPAFDTSIASTFTQIHGSTASGWTRTAGQTQINNTNYNDGTGTLATLTANQWGVRWVFMDVDPAGASLSMLVGATNGSEAEANAASLPSDLPPELRRTAPGVLISKIVIQKSAASVTASWISNYDSVAQRQSTPTIEHDSLGGIKGNGFHHLSEAERDAAIRIATTSQSGLMSAAQAQVVGAITTGGGINGGIGIHGLDLVALAANGTREYIIKAGISDAPGDLLFLGNATLADGQFVPNFGAIKNDSTNSTLIFTAYTTTQLDAGTSPLTLFLARTTTLANDPLNGTVGDISNRPLFSFKNNNTTLGQVEANSNWGIGSNVGAAISARLTVRGSGSTIATTTLLLENSTGTDSLYVRDDGMFFSSGGRIEDYETHTSDVTLTPSSKSCVVFNPSGTGQVGTMHLSPANGILQRTVNSSAFAVTLGRNGQKMAGDEANYTLPAYTAIDWQYYGATIGWLPVSISTW